MRTPPTNIDRQNIITKTEINFVLLFTILFCKSIKIMSQDKSKKKLKNFFDKMFDAFISCL